MRAERGARIPWTGNVPESIVDWVAGTDPEHVARQALAFSRFDIEVRPALVNGAGGTVTFRDGQPFAIAGFTIRNRRIVEMDVLADPERLSRLDLARLD